MLCEACEARLNEIDAFGTDILLKQYEKYFHALSENGRAVAFESTSVENARLLQFLISVLWRASVSNEYFYRNVQLGSYEITAQEIAFSPSVPDSFGVFDALLSRWRDDQDLGFTAYPIFDPTREKWHDGVTVYRFYFGDVVAYIKVDSRPFQTEFKPISLLYSPSVKVLTRNISTSKDVQAMVATAKNRMTTH